MNNTIKKRRRKAMKETQSCECPNQKVAWRSGDKLIPMKIEDAKECKKYFRQNPDAPPEDAERWRMKTEQTKVDRCKMICEKFDSCDLVQIGQPNNPPECTEFYNNDMFRQFYKSKDEILEHIKSFGYIPNTVNDDNDNFLDVDINILGNDGKLFPLFVRHYVKDVDKEWEFESQDFYEFGKKITTFGGSRELIKSAMKSKDNADEMQVINNKCTNCGKIIDMTGPYIPGKCSSCGQPFNPNPLPWLD